MPPKRATVDETASPESQGRIILPQKPAPKKQATQANKEPLTTIDMRQTPAWKAAKVLAGGDETRLTIVNETTVIIDN